MIPIADREASIQLIGFYAGGKFFGVDILTIREILRDPLIEPIQNAPAFIEGCVRIRGEVVPVISLKKRFGNARSTHQSDQYWVLITSVSGRVFGLIVDSVTRILKINENSILAAPDIILSGLRRQYIQGVCNTELGMLVVLDLNRMLGVDEIQALKKVAMSQSI